jgi:hypothetical protein
MPLDKKGGFRMNPQIARMHDANPKPAFGHGDPKEKQRLDPGQQEDGKGHVELHKGEHAEAPGAAYHTIHHPGGEVRGHETLHDAHHAMNEHYAEDGCKGHGTCEHGEGSEAEAVNDVGEAEAGADSY